MHHTTPANHRSAREVWADWLTSCLRLLPAETAHHLGIMSLKHRLASPLMPHPHEIPSDPRLICKVDGLGTLRHPIGLAAGFDKNAECPESLIQTGFSMVELGTITPRPQSGNPKPRIFRQKDQLAVINRLGFNSEGQDSVFQRLNPKVTLLDQEIIGINVGKNKTTPEEGAMSDFLQVIHGFKELARYFTVNLSSPNTPGLRALATPAFVDQLAIELGELKQKTWIKLDPDRSKSDLQQMVSTIAQAGYAGIILTNTRKMTLPESGGQSGHNLSLISAQVMEWAYEVHKGSLPMIGCGGIMTGLDALQRIMRGAAALQIYTAYVYRGPWVVARMLQELLLEMERYGFRDLDEARFSHYR